MTPYTIILPTIYGQMIVNRFDINQTNCLFKTCRAIDHAEIAMVCQLVAESGCTGTVLDIGANFGTYTMALARLQGIKVHAFEPQRILANMIAGSVALNSLENVWVHADALGATVDAVEIPKFDYSKEMNFGSVEFGPEQREPLTQVRQKYEGLKELCAVNTVDVCFGAWNDIIFMKIDAEGMEGDVLTGASATIDRCRPLMLVEHLKNDKEQLRRMIEAKQYQVEDTGMNFLCKPL